VTNGAPSGTIKYHFELEMKKKDVLDLKFFNSLNVWWLINLVP
jgi:hypothetical protein